MHGWMGWCLAILLWLGLGFSVGWYYTVTYYGRTGLPIPTPEVCAALVVYYFSVLNVDTEIQALHWMLAFPVSGALWTLSLVVSARRFGASGGSSGRCALYLAMANAPLVLPGPWMAWVAGATDAGYDWSRMMDVALRRGWVSPWDGLNALYLTLGVGVLMLQGWAYCRAFELRGRQALTHALASGVVLVVSAAVLGALGAWPLRALFE